jgi:thiamine biosynthesis lipoprotein
VSSIRRARPWLGTLVDIRIDESESTRALRALEAAFAEVAIVHRVMSFQSDDSDLARLRCAPVGSPVRVNARTHEVLAWSLRIAAASAGAFDPVAAAMASGADWATKTGVPPRQASWRDIELLDGEHVRLRRPLWIDLGGIAKGYAVDRAIDVLHAHGVTRACVNAGGDLRVCGDIAQRIDVRAADGRLHTALDLAEGALATSCSGTGRHVHGASGQEIAAGVTVSVVAERAIVADALTKVVLADSALAAGVLEVFSAQAWRHDDRCGWQVLRMAA